MRALSALLLVAAGCSERPLFIGGIEPQPFHELTLTAESHPIALVAGDFNGDGHPDLVASNDGSQSLSVFIGLGDGSFALGAVRVGANGLLAVSDLDGDGRLDLVVGAARTTAGAQYTLDYSRCMGSICMTSVIAVLLGNGDGTFRDGPTYGDTTVSIGPRGLRIADVNRDHRPDIVYTRVYENGDEQRSLGVLLGNGDGSFQPERLVDVGAEAPTDVELTDVDGDGNLDALVATEVRILGIRLLRGKGDGSFEPATIVWEGYGPCRLLTTLDLNGDGNLDLAAADCVQTGDSSMINLLFGNGHGVFGSPIRQDLGDRMFVGLAAGDFDGDGQEDLVVPAYYAGRSRLVLEVPGGGVRERLELPSGNKPRAVVTADFDSDGTLDLAVANEGGSSLSVLLHPADAPSTPIQ